MNVSHDRRPRWDIGDVLDRTDLASLLDELTQPAERHGPGRRWHCPAPNHEDHRASVTLHRDHSGHERWRCWSGDHRGDAVDLVMVTSTRTRADAIDWLANRAGLMPNQPLPMTTQYQSLWLHATRCRCSDCKVFELLPENESL